MILWYCVYRWILSQLSDEMTEEELDEIIAAIDTDGSGTVDYGGMLSSISQFILHRN